MLDAGHFTHHIGSITGVYASTISRLHSKECSELYKSSGGCLTKLSLTNIHHAVYLIMLGSRWLSTTARGVVDGFGIGLCARYKPSEIHRGSKGSYFLLRSHWGSCFSGLCNYTLMTEFKLLLWLRYWWWRRLSPNPAPHRTRCLVR